MSLAAINSISTMLLLWIVLLSYHGFSEATNSTDQTTAPIVTNATTTGTHTSATVVPTTVITTVTALPTTSEHTSSVFSSVSTHPSNSTLALGLGIGLGVAGLIIILLSIGAVVYCRSRQSCCCHTTAADSPRVLPTKNELDSSITSRNNHGVLPACSNGGYASDPGVSHAASPRTDLTSPMAPGHEYTPTPMRTTEPVSLTTKNYSNDKFREDSPPEIYANVATIPQEFNEGIYANEEQAVPSVPDDSRSRQVSGSSGAFRVVSILPPNTISTSFYSSPNNHSSSYRPNARDNMEMEMESLPPPSGVGHTQPKSAHYYVNGRIVSSLAEPTVELQRTVPENAESSDEENYMNQEDIIVAQNTATAKNSIHTNSEFPNRFGENRQPYEGEQDSDYENTHSWGVGHAR